MATGLTAGILYVTVSIYTKTFFLLLPLINVQGTYLLCGAIGVIGFFYLWVYMPETEGKNIAEIEELFVDDARKSCSHFQKKK